MSESTATANGQDPVIQKAAFDAYSVQPAVNLVAVVDCFHRHLVAMQRAGVTSDELVNHPITLTFVSKLHSLCRITDAREDAAFEATGKLMHGEQVEYELLPHRRL